MDDLLARLAELPAWQMGLAAAWLLLLGGIMPSLPEEMVVIALGVLCGRGRIGFLEGLAAVLAGLLPANLGAVLLGRLLGRGLSKLGPVARVLDAAAVQGALAALRRHGSAFVFLTRFTPLVRGPVYLAAGVAGMPIARFARADALAACFHVPGLLWAGWMLGRGAGSLVEALGRVGWVGAGLAGLALVLYGVRRSRSGGDAAAAGPGGSHPLRNAPP
jgi:membrane protein DedA with SNARE-associated domain